jgi:uracil-DNA glycosylase
MKEIHACRPWLEAELEAVRPILIVCLGETAAQSLLGSSFRITQSHGMVQKIECLPPIIGTLHPAAILRARTDEDRERDTKILLDDLRRERDIVEPSVLANNWL